jgi:hypothetical protein
MKEETNNEITEKQYKSLIKVFKKYTNLYKILYYIDPAKSAEFLKKQEYYFTKANKNEKEKVHNHDHDHHEGCNKLERKMYIPKEEMNNIEKLLDEIATTSFYKGNFEEVLQFFSDKYDKIVQAGQKDGLGLDEKTEKELLHKFLLEGVPFYFTNKLRQRLKSYEESISEQPMLLAHPSSVTKKDLINLIQPDCVK